MCDKTLIEILVCPYDRLNLSMNQGKLVCENKHSFNIIDGIPVLLRNDVPETLWVAKASLTAAENSDFYFKNDPYFTATLGIDEKDRELVKEKCKDKSHSVDPVVQELIVATCGNLYRTLKSNLGRYPIPKIALGSAQGNLLLDIGCNWGRWSIAAANKGYKVVGLDPSLGAVLAAKRLSKHYGHDISFVVADSRYLPFKEKTFDNVYSYSVFQHFSKEDFLLSAKQISNVLKERGICLVQMANKFGLISLFHQLKRGFSTASEFQVRYWSIKELKKAFSSIIGHCEISIDTYFGLGAQSSDIDMMHPLIRLGYNLSECLKKIANKVPLFIYFSDSIFFLSRKNGK